MEIYTLLCALIVCSVFGGALTCQAPDVEDISRVLADMPDWKELADSLNIRSSDVETNCAQDVSQPSCYRRDLVRRYCDSQQSGDPSKVAEDIAQSLRKMKYEPQAQQLRNLGFESRQFSGSSITAFIQQNWTSCLGAVVTVIIVTCGVYYFPRGRGREEKVKETGQKTTRPPQPLDHMGGHSGGQATVQPTKSSQSAPRSSEKRKKLETRLQSAIKSQNIEEIEKMIAEGMDPNEPFQDSLGWTPLMEASSKGYTQVAKLLLEKGANPNVENYLGQTPLIEATSKGYTEVAKVLLEKKADPNMENDEGWTALMEASYTGHYGIVDLLLKHGANPDQQDYDNWGALFAAVHHDDEDIALRLVEAGATPHIQSKSEGGTNAIFLAIIRDQPKVIQAFLDHQPDLNVQNKYGETVLMTACMIKDLNLVQELLEQNADPNIKRDNGDSPLLVATNQENVQMVEALLKAGARTNEGSMPPLHLAVKVGGRDIVHLLLKHGADPALKDQYGVTAYQVASRMNHTEVAQMISPEQPTESTSLKNTLDALTELHNRLSRLPMNRTKAVQSCWNKRKENTF